MLAGLLHSLHRISFLMLKEIYYETPSLGVLASLCLIIISSETNLPIFGTSTKASSLSSPLSIDFHTSRRP